MLALLVDDDEQNAQSLTLPLKALGIDVRLASFHDSVEAAAGAAADAILVSDSSGKAKRKELVKQLAMATQSAASPVVLLSDDPSSDPYGGGLTMGPIARVSWRLSRHDMARRIHEVLAALSEQPGFTSGQAKIATLDRVIGLFCRDRRSGIVSVNVPPRPDRSDRSHREESLRLALRAGEPLITPVTDFVSRVRENFSGHDSVRYVFEQLPSTQLGALDPALVNRPPGSLRSRRILIIDRDSQRARQVAVALRERNAQVLTVGAQARELSRAQHLDPEVVIVDPHDFEGACYQQWSAMRQHPRLRWAGLLLVPHGQLWPAGGSRPQVDALAAAIESMRAGDQDLIQQGAQAGEFGARLEVTGPARMLRALGNDRKPRHVTVRSGDTRVQVSLNRGMVTSALSDQELAASGTEALSLLLSLEVGRVEVGANREPERSNLMLPIDAALRRAAPKPAPRSRTSTAPGRNKARARKREVTAEQVAAGPDQDPTAVMRRPRSDPPEPAAARWRGGEVHPELRGDQARKPEASLEQLSSLASPPGAAPPGGPAPVRKKTLVGVPATVPVSTGARPESSDLQAAPPKATEADPALPYAHPAATLLGMAPPEQGAPEASHPTKHQGPAGDPLAEQRAVLETAHPASTLPGMPSREPPPGPVAPPQGPRQAGGRANLGPAPPPVPAVSTNQGTRPPEPVAGPDATLDVRDSEVELEEHETIDWDQHRMQQMLGSLYEQPEPEAAPRYGDNPWGAATEPRAPLVQGPAAQVAPPGPGPSRPAQARDVAAMDPLQPFPTPAQRLVARARAHLEEASERLALLVDRVHEIEALAKMPRSAVAAGLAVAVAAPLLVLIFALSGSGPDDAATQGARAEESAPAASATDQPRAEEAAGAGVEEAAGAGAAEEAAGAGAAEEAAGAGAAEELRAGASREAEHEEPQPAIVRGRNPQAAAAKSSRSASVTAKARAKRRAALLTTQGHALRRAGKLAAAEAKYTRALRADPDSVRATMGMALAKLKRKDRKGSVRWAKRAVRRRSGGATQLLLGDAYHLAGNKKLARRAWRKGARLGNKTARKRLKTKK